MLGSLVLLSPQLGCDRDFPFAAAEDLPGAALRAGDGRLPVRVRETGHGADGGVRSSTRLISSPSPAIRCTSPERAAWSGSSARRVVVSGPVVTLQSSNCARSVLSAWPVKVIS